MAASKMCIDCGAITATSPCTACKRARGRRRERGRPSPTQRGYGAPWRRLRARVLDAWIRDNGEICPGFRCRPHPPWPGNPLTVDHIVAKIDGGTDDLDNLAVLCKSCQGRKGQTERPSW